MIQQILVTGAAGFIGFHLSQQLLLLGYRVTGIDNMNDYYDPSLKRARVTLLSKSDKFTFIQQDIADFQAMKSVFITSKPEIVIHLAAQAGVRYSIENPFAYLHSNETGFLNMIELSHRTGVNNFIFASSSSVYGNNTKIPFSVSDAVDHPISYYAATKKSNELTAHVYSHLYHLPVTGFRFFTVYGPWGRPDMAYFKFTQAILKGEAIPVYNQGDMKRDFTYVDDIIAGIIAAVNKPFHFEIFNLGNHRSEKLLDMIALLETYTRKKAMIRWEPMQPGDVKETYADIDKTREMLGFEPAITLADGLERFVHWFKDYYHI